MAQIYIFETYRIEKSACISHLSDFIYMYKYDVQWKIFLALGIK